MTLREIFLQRCDTPHNIDQHLPVLFGYGAMVNRVVELGTDIGFSTSAWLAAGVTNLDCYDINITPFAEELLRKSRVSHTYMRLHKEDSLTATIPECDLLFVDTIHTYEQVLAELRRHAPKSSQFIILHDIVSCPEIVPAIRDYFLRHTEWRLREWSTMQSGLAIFERSSNG